MCAELLTDQQAPSSLAVRILPVSAAPGPQCRHKKENFLVRMVWWNRGVSAPAERDANRLGGIVRCGFDDPVLELGIVANLGI